MKFALILFSAIYVVGGENLETQARRKELQLMMLDIEQELKSLENTENIITEKKQTPIQSYLTGLRMQQEGIRLGHASDQCHPKSRMRDVLSYQEGLSSLEIKTTSTIAMPLESNQKITIKSSITTTKKQTPIHSYLMGIRMQQEGIRIGHGIDQCHPLSRMRAIVSYQMGISLLGMAMIREENTSESTIISNSENEETETDVALTNITPISIFDLFAIEKEESIPSESPDDLTDTDTVEKSSNRVSIVNPISETKVTEIQDIPQVASDEKIVELVNKEMVSIATTGTGTAPPQETVDKNSNKEERMKNAIRMARMKARASGALSKKNVQTRQNATNDKKTSTESVNIAPNVTTASKADVAPEVVQKLRQRSLNLAPKHPIQSSEDEVPSDTSTASWIGGVALFVGILGLLAGMVSINYTKGSKSSRRRSSYLDIPNDSWSYSSSSSFGSNLSRRRCSQTLPL